MTFRWKDFQVPELPEGRSGRWRVGRFEIDPVGAALSVFQYGPSRVPEAGTHTALYRYSSDAQEGWPTVIMSDTRAEIRDHVGLYVDAHEAESVLVLGLGLGVGLKMIMASEKVRTVTVIEQSADVIALTGEHWKAVYGDRLELIEADAYEWKPPKGRRWDLGWADIWDAICPDNLPEMSKLRRKYGRRLGRRMACWAEAECRLNRYR